MISASKIKELARQAGFELCGIASVRCLDEQSERLSQWLAEGYDSGLTYMGRNTDKRLDPAILYEGAESVIVCAANYKNGFWNQRASRNPKISSYALSLDYHVTMKERLSSVLEGLAEEYPGLRGRCFTDSAPVLEKSWAIEAGLGWRGKNSLVITPPHGSFVFLGEIIITAEADLYDEPFAGERCGTCTACIDACPNSAIVRPYVIDTNRCISRLTTERVAQAGAAAPNTHGWIFGCDICQSVCPHNSRTPLASGLSFRPLFNPSAAGKEFWNGLDKEGFEQVFGTTPLARTGFETIKERATGFFEEKEGSGEGIKPYGKTK